MSMTEKPILFSGPMVRAILDGRKTVTRRIVKPQPDAIHGDEPYWNIGGYRLRADANNPLKCPYGSSGTRLWVRETWAVCAAYECYAPSVLTPHVGTIQYQAGGGMLNGEMLERTCFDVDGELGRWRPSIHMPRWVSRISLEVTDVRVERLQDITEEDAIAEGIERTSGGNYWKDYLHPVMPAMTARYSFASLWKSINGPDSWEANPWVWTIAFNRLKP